VEPWCGYFLGGDVMLQNFTDQKGPPVSAAWLNAVDAYVNGSSSPAYIPQTAAELAAGVTPVNLLAWPGYASRYVNNTTPGTTDTAAGINAALLQGAQPGGALAVIPAAGDTWAIGSQLTLPSGTSLIIQGNVLALGSFPSNTAMIAMGTTAVGATTVIEFQGGSLDGNYSGTTCIANGIDVICGRARIHQPTIQHFPSYGIRLASTQSGDSYVYDPEIQQWNNGDPAANTQANYTADGIYFNRADCFVIGGYVRWCLYCLHFGNSARTCWAIGTHLYQGNATVPQIDPVLVQVEVNASSIELHDIYFDSGHGKFYSPDVNIVGGYAIQAVSQCAFSASLNMFQVIANGTQTEPYQFGFAIKNQYLPASNSPHGATGATVLLGYENNGGNVWSGSYADLPTILSNLGFQAVRATGGDVIVHHRNDDLIPTQTVMKPGGDIILNYRIGGSQVAEVYISTGSYVVSAPFFWVKNPAGAGNVSLVAIGFIGASVSDDGGGNLTFATNSITRWNIGVSSGNLTPQSDKSYTIGNAGNRILEAFLAAPAAGTPALSVDTSAQGGGSTVTLTLTTFPGTNAGAKALHYLPVTCDGSKYWIPLLPD
jgi:hypothetical protein